MMDTDETLLVMIHKRIRKHAGYDLDSDHIRQALNEQGYTMENPEVMEGMAHLKELGYLRAFEDVEDLADGESKVTRYWGLEITPEGAMKAISLMDQFRYGRN